MFQLITSSSTRLNQAFIFFFPLELYRSLETLPTSLRAGGHLKTASPQWSALWGRLLHPVAFCFLRMPYGTLGTPWTLRGIMPSSMLCGILRVSRCHTKHQGHSVPDPRVTVQLPKSHIQEAGPGKGQRLLRTGKHMGQGEKKEVAGG